jgi:hypothetical protein
MCGGGNGGRERGAVMAAGSASELADGAADEGGDRGNLRSGHSRVYGGTEGVHSSGAPRSSAATDRTRAGSLGT